jgi:Ser/Thr protein kinase RdoA (MazF antagonist)
MPQMTAQAFTAAHARRAAESALAAFGASGQDLELKRMGENALFRASPGGFAVRVSRPGKDLARVRRELCIVSHLMRRPSPRVIRLAGGQAEPLVVEGGAVVLFEWLEAREGPQMPRDLGRMARELHGIPALPCVLGHWDPIDRIERRLTSLARHGSPFQRSAVALLRPLVQAADEVVHAAGADTSGWGLIHGDLHVGNMMNDRHGSVLIDFEEATNGPRVWDLIPMAVAVKRISGDIGSLTAVVDAYGGGYTTEELLAHPLCRVRELTMTTWLLQNVETVDGAREEVELRIDGIHDGGGPTWSVF